LIRQVLAVIDAGKRGEDWEKDIQARRAAIEAERSA
jgi:hypothetical protein